MLSVPFGGNAFITKKAASAAEVIGDGGLGNWTSAATVSSVYFRVENAVELNLALRIKVPEGKSSFTVSAEGKTYTLSASGSAYHTVNVGKIGVKKAGYVKVDLQGKTRTGAYFGDVSDLLVSGDSSLVYVKNNNDNYFHWGRRGPSVHLRYAIPAQDNDRVEWFYNEVTVPKGEDTEGSYFMANGFGEGYFGMQVNSASERRVLFSVWSPYTTDDPNSIPDSMKIRLLEKGEGVQTGEFGNEGSGGQSYLVYPWEAGKTYAFLTRATPDATGNTTVYAAYFKMQGEKGWKLIARFRRPQTHTYLKSLYSFLENFNPETGFTARKGLYGNQWIGTSDGRWQEITSATFTADATAGKNYRKDYAGGAEGRSFYLKNCGFFAGFTPVNTVLKRSASGEGKPEMP
ncbi:MAG: DUF3472 domain-containing protein [Mucilaginibacter polytrichastri]|nr:DUF3472 domain-containing protein [Mucilaginibacter polytrichastri]